MRWTIILAIFLLILGLSVYGLAIYLQPETTVAFDQPISLSPNHMHFDFHTYYNARYRIAIQFDQPTQIKYNPIDCVSSDGFPKDECLGIPAGFKGTWTLTENGQPFRQEQLPEKLWRLSEPFTANLCRFKAKRDANYQLDLDIQTDGSALNIAQPRLSASVREPEMYAFPYLGAGLFPIFFAFIATLFLLFGIALLVASIWESRTTQTTTA